MTALYVSPHLDDAAFSCAGGLIARTSRGERIVVCTVFSDGAPRRLYAARRRADTSALARLGAEVVHLDFEDAPTRLGRPPSFVSLVCEAHVAEAVVRDVATAVAGVVARVQPDELWLPLGVGGHVDHRTVYSACAALRADARYYEERPYAFVPALRALRELDLCGGEVQAPADASAIARQFDDGACARLLRDDERESAVGEVQRRLTSRWPSTGARLRVSDATYDAATLDAAAALITTYESEVRWLFGAEKVRDLWARLAAAGGRWFEREVRVEAVP